MFSVDVVLDLALDELQSSGRHICLSDSLNLLDAVILAELIEVSEDIVHYLYNRALALLDDLIEFANVTKQNCNFSGVVSKEIF